MPTETDQKPSFFAILPANVRYDKELKSTAKLLYAEISSLTNKEGYCWASNKYFAELYDVDHKTISRLISQLEERGHITIEIDQINGNFRKIHLVIEKHIGSDKKVTTPSDEKVTHNNKDINIKFNTITTVMEETHVSSNTQTLMASEFFVDGNTRSGRKRTTASQSCRPKNKALETPKEYGAIHITNCINYLKNKLDIPVLDGSDKTNRQYCNLLMKKFCKKDAYPIEKEQAVKDIIDLAVKDSFWQYKITSFEILYNKAVQIISSTRQSSRFAAVQL